VFTTQEMKLWRMALDPGAQPGEITNAATLLIGILRKRSFTPEMLTNGHKPKPEPEQPKAKPKQKQKKDNIDPGSVVFSFGKHKGKRIDETPADYLRWIHSWITDGDEDLKKKFNWLKKTIEEYWNA
jgi:hypothetical protein